MEIGKVDKKVTELDIFGLLVAIAVLTALALNFFSDLVSLPIEVCIVLFIIDVLYAIHIIGHTERMDHHHLLHHRNMM